MNATTPDNLPPLREVIARHGLRAKKSMGQNFLLDLNLTRKIARAAAPLQGHAIIEVGPGPGGLTRALLLEGAERIIAIERDERALPALEEIATRWPGRLAIIHGDALQQDWPALIAEHAPGLPVKIVANLPYNIATPLLTSWLMPPKALSPSRPPCVQSLGGREGERAGAAHFRARKDRQPASDDVQAGHPRSPWPPFWTSLTLMFQREVAERICAQPGTKSYGRLAILGQWRSQPRILFEVPPRAFTPPPKVTSAIVHIEPADAPPCPVDARTLERLTAAAFGQRRKMLRQSLKALLKDPLPLLQAANIAPTKRAEELDVDDYIRLACLLEQQHASG